jgi:rRNA-processing protein FCF1
VRRLGDWVGAEKVVVVTSDRALADAAREAGAAVEPSSGFRAALERL